MRTLLPDPRRAARRAISSLRSMFIGPAAVVFVARRTSLTNEVQQSIIAPSISRCFFSSTLRESLYSIYLMFSPGSFQTVQSTHPARRYAVPADRVLLPATGHSHTCRPKHAPGVPHVGLPRSTCSPGRRLLPWQAMASKVSTSQRETVVDSRLSTKSTVMMIIEFPGASSRVLSSAFWASVLAD